MSKLKEMDSMTKEPTNSTIKRRNSVQNIASSQLQVGQKSVREIKQLMNSQSQVKHDCNENDCQTKKQVFQKMHTPCPLLAKQTVINSLQKSYRRDKSFRYNLIHNQDQFGHNASKSTSVSKIITGESTKIGSETTDSEALDKEKEEENPFSSGKALDDFESRFELD